MIWLSWRSQIVIRKLNVTMFLSVSSDYLSITVVPKVQKQPPEVFCKKAALRNFAIFT